ncbi:MAG: MFS transporter [Pseudomonadota bacterium]
MIDLSFFRRSASWLFATFLLAFASSFGQTFFISLFGAEIRSSFGLSHGEFGQIYLAGTVLSAAVLIWLGKTADNFRVITLGIATILALAVAAVGMASVTAWWMLIPVIFALRLFGQGMLTHISMTAAARWFDKDRGKALAISSLGYPVGEAIWPSVVVALILAIGWRETWLTAAGFLVLVLIPVFTLLLAGKPASPRDAAGHDDAGNSAKTQWTRAAVLRSPLFYLLMPGLIASPFIGTGVIFHQAYLVEVKGWTLRFFAASFAAYPVASVLTAFVTGFLVDRFTARRLLPFFLMPMAAALLVLAGFSAHAAAPVAMALLGMTAGAASSMLGAIWAELYGTRHIGAIRALAMAQMVFATALAPGIMGWLIDGGITLESQFLAMTAYTLAVSVGFFGLQPVLHSTAET